MSSYGAGKFLSLSSTDGLSSDRSGTYPKWDFEGISRINVFFKRQVEQGGVFMFFLKFLQHT